MSTDSNQTRGAVDQSADSLERTATNLHKAGYLVVPPRPGLPDRWLYRMQAFPFAAEPEIPLTLPTGQAIVYKCLSGSTRTAQ